MNMKITSSFKGVVFSLVLILGLFCGVNYSHAAELHVGSGQTIAGVINGADNGDTIIVDNDYATSTEVFPFTIAKSVTLDCQGNSISSPSDYADYQKLVTLTASSTVIRNCNFIDTRLFTSNPNNTVITNNIFSRTFTSSTENIYGGASMITAYSQWGSFSNLYITSNTIRMAYAPESWAANQGENKAISVISRSHSDSVNSENINITGNKIDVSRLNNGERNACIYVYMKDIPNCGMDVLISHNTCIAPQPAVGGANKGLYLLNDGASTGVLDITLEYNIFANSTTGTTAQTEGVYYRVENGALSNVAGGYNGYYNFGANITKSEDVTGHAGGLGGLGPNDLSSNPFFKTTHAGTDSDFQLYEFSPYLDVTGTIDMGSSPGSRVHNFLVGDQTWYKDFTNTTTELAVYSTSSMFGSQDSTSTWMYVGTSPETFLNSSMLSDNDSVAIFPGNYGSVDMTSSLKHIVIGNYAWAAYLPIQFQSKIWGMTLRNSQVLGGPAYSGNYDCESIYTFMNTYDFSGDGNTLWSQVSQQCTAVEAATGIRPEYCSSVSTYVSYMCAAPTAEANRVIFNANSGGGAFTAHGLVSSTLFGLTFANASTSIYNAFAAPHSYYAPYISGASINQHYYTIDGHDYKNNPYVLDYTSGLNLGFWTFMTSSPAVITSTNITRSMQNMPSPMNFSLGLYSFDMNAITGGATSGIAYATVYMRSDLATTTVPDGFNLDCLAENVLTFSTTTYSYTYHDPVCIYGSASTSPITVSETPVINLVTSSLAYTEDLNDGIAVQLNGSYIIFDINQMGGGEAPEPGVMSSIGLSDITAYISSTPQNLGLIVANVDAGLTQGGSPSGEIVHMATYMRNDALPSGMSINDLGQYLVQQFGGSLICTKENVFSYSNGAYTYSAPDCAGITVSGTPAINFEASGYAGLRLIDSYNNDLYGNDFRNNAYGVWLDGNSHSNTFVGTLTDNIFTEENYWNREVENRSDIEDAFRYQSMRNAAALLYMYSDAVFTTTTASGTIYALADADLAIDTPSEMVSSTIADIYSTVVASAGHNSFYNVGANLSQVIVSSTIPTNLYYRGRNHTINSSLSVLPSAVTTLRSADNNYTFSGTSNASGYSSYSNNLLAASLYLPNNTSSTAGGHNPYTAATGAYSRAANLTTRNQTFDTAVYVAQVSSSGGGGGGGGGGGPSYLDISDDAVKVKGGNYVTSRDIVLLFNVPLASHLAVSRIEDFSNLVWKEYSTSRNFQLSEGLGEKKLYVMFRTARGIASKPRIISVYLVSSTSTIGVTTTTVSNVTNQVIDNITVDTSGNEVLSDVIFTGIPQVVRPGSQLKFNYTFTNVSTKALPIRLVRSLVRVSDNKVISSVKGTATVKAKKSTTRVIKDTLSKSLAEGNYIERVSVYNSKTGKLVDQNEFEFEVAAETLPTETVLNDKMSNIIFTNTPSNAKPGNQIKFSYTFTNTSAKTISIRLSRALVRLSDSKIISRVNGYSTVKSQKSTTRAIKEKLSKSLAEGNYVERIWVYDGRTGKLIDQNEFEFEVVK